MTGTDVYRDSTPGEQILSEGPGFMSGFWGGIKRTFNNASRNSPNAMKWGAFILAGLVSLHFGNRFISSIFAGWGATGFLGKSVSFLLALGLAYAVANGTARAQMAHTRILNENENENSTLGETFKREALGAQAGAEEAPAPETGTAAEPPETTEQQRGAVPPPGPGGMR